MTTFSFYPFRILKISPYINFKKNFGRILAPPSGQLPGVDAPLPPLATPVQSPTLCFYTTHVDVLNRFYIHKLTTLNITIEPWPYIGRDNSPSTQNS